MSEFDKLMEQGTESSIGEAYELLRRHDGAAEPGIEATLEFSSEAVEPPDIDWDRLERIALSPTVIERIEGVWSKADNVKFGPALASLLLLGVIAGLSVTAVWAQAELFAANVSVLHMLFVVFLVLGLLSLSIMILTFGAMRLALSASYRATATGKREPAAFQWMQRTVAPAIACSLLLSVAFVAGKTGANLSPFNVSLSKPAVATAKATIADASRETAFNAGMANMINADPKILKLGPVEGDTSKLRTEYVKLRIIKEPAYRDAVLTQWRSKQPETYALMQDALASRSDQAQIGMAVSTMALSRAALTIKDSQNKPLAASDPRWRTALSGITADASAALSQALNGGDETLYGIKSVEGPCHIDAAAGAPAIVCPIKLKNPEQELTGVIDLEELDLYWRTVKAYDASRSDALQEALTSLDAAHTPNAKPVVYKQR